MTTGPEPEPLGGNDLAALAEHVQHADPAAFHIPNATVARLLAMLDAERRRADEAEQMQNITFAEWAVS